MNDCIAKEVAEIFNLLERKNSYLLEFHKINNKEIMQLSRGCIQNLENFYYSRELLLNAINRLDKQFKDKNFSRSCEMNSQEKKKLSEMLKLKNNMIQSILNQDVTILSLVDKLNEGKLPIAS